MIKKMNTDTLTWRVHVVDKQGRPVPAPTIWRMIPDEDATVNAELMQRLVRRYASQADFVQSLEVNPKLMVDYADRNGLFLHSDTVTYHKGSEVITIYAVIKRGYIPTVISDVAHKNTTHDVTLVMEPDSDAKVDSRMLQFDLVRASAHAPVLPGAEMMQEERRQALLQTHQQLRSLGQNLEKDRKDDLASAVYYNLAYLPSVDVIKNADGDEMIVGYTNGYISTDPQRRAARDAALRLNQKNPQLKVERFREKLGIQSKSIAEFSSSERKQYTDFVEKVIQQHGDQIYPRTLMNLFYHYQYEGAFAQACYSLRRAYQFEPTYQTEPEWRSLLNRLNKQASRSDYQGQACTIEGL